MLGAVYNSASEELVELGKTGETDRHTYRQTDRQTYRKNQKPHYGPGKNTSVTPQ